MFDCLITLAYWDGGEAVNSSQELLWVLQTEVACALLHPGASGGWRGFSHSQG